MTDEHQISAEQRTQLDAKVEELHRLHDSLEGKSPEERHSAMQAKHDELSSWAEQSGVPLDLLPSPRPPKPTAS